MLLEVRGLRRKYGSAEILRGIDLDVVRGDVFVTIGPTGAGKTTLLRLVGLLDRPTSGSISFGGRKVVDAEKARLEVRRRMAMVFQKPAVFNASVFDNVAYGLKVRGRKEPGRRTEVMNALETVGLSGYEKRNARTLSGGETQRVALARAMVVQPELLLLDEPTANLDPVSTSNMEKLILDVIRKSGMTVVMSTHDLFQAQRLGNRMGVLMGGEMTQTGDPAQIFTQPESRRVAEFVGVENMLAGVVVSNDAGMVMADIGGGCRVEALSGFGPGREVHVCIRPEEITLASTKELTSARNCFGGEITRIVLFGPLARIELDCGFPLVALVTRRSAEEMNLQTSARVYAFFKATGVHIIKR